MIKQHQEGVSGESNQCDTCAEPQSVLYFDFAGESSSEESGLGAFILSITEILFELDAKGEENGDDSID